MSRSICFTASCYCCVSNRVDFDVLRENPALHTTKREAQEHGYGIPAIKKIAELYQGMTDFEVQNGEFVASVMLLCDGFQTVQTQKW